MQRDATELGPESLNPRALAPSKDLLGAFKLSFAVHKNTNRSYPSCSIFSLTREDSDLSVNGLCFKKTNLSVRCVPELRSQGERRTLGMDHSHLVLSRPPPTPARLPRAHPVGWSCCAMTDELPGGPSVCAPVPSCLPSQLRPDPVVPRLLISSGLRSTLRSLQVGDTRPLGSGGSRGFSQTADISIRH